LRRYAAAQARKAGCGGAVVAQHFQQDLLQPGKMVGCRLDPTQRLALSGFSFQGGPGRRIAPAIFRSGHRTLRFCCSDATSTLGFAPC
jgi:hypothetical protein